MADRCDPPFFFEIICLKNVGNIPVFFDRNPLFYSKLHIFDF